MHLELLIDGVGGPLFMMSLFKRICCEAATDLWIMLPGTCFSIFTSFRRRLGYDSPFASGYTSFTVAGSSVFQRTIGAEHVFFLALSRR